MDESLVKHFTIPNKTLEFEWEDPCSLVVLLRSEIVGVTVMHWRDTKTPSIIFFKKLSGEIIRVQSNMHDIATRVEVGVLVFSREITELVTHDLNYIHGMTGNNLVQKLTLIESGTKAECGIMITSRIGSRIVVLPGVAPFSLAILGIEGVESDFRPEYKLERYEVESF